MRILLVKPKARLGPILGLQAYQLLEPLELGYVAASVPEDHEVRVLDLRLYRFDRHAFLRTLSRYNPDLVGFTGYSHESGAVRRLARLVRENLRSAKVVAGGHHATMVPHDYDVPEIDIVVRGEGCTPFRALVTELSAGREPEGIPNVYFPGRMTGTDALKIWPKYADPGTLPSPRRDLWDVRSYRSVWAGENSKSWSPLFPPVSQVRASWGCRAKCTFCVVPFLSDGKHMPRPADAVAEEIARAPAEHIYFCDDENFIDQEFGFELADAIERRGIHKRYFAWTRATSVNRSMDLMRKWRSIGLDCVFIGFEFTNDEDLKRVKKGGNVAANEKALENLRSVEIGCHAAFMVQPEYTEDDFAKLRAYVHHLPPAECSFTVCTPSPGTSDYDAIRHKIWVKNPYELYDCMHPLTPTVIPLRRYAALLARQAAEGTARTPRRVQRRPAPPLDMVKVFRADRRWYTGYRDLYRDYPRELWDTVVKPEKRREPWRVALAVAPGEEGCGSHEGVGCDALDGHRNEPCHAPQPASSSRAD
jgi:radical SAM superfamily enzyme YgiQ (UPF0313 family)